MAYHQGFLYVCWQNGTYVEVRVLDAAGERVGGALHACSNGSFPRLMSADGAWHLAFRGPDEHIRLLRDGVLVWTSPVRAGGNDCVALGRDHDGIASLAWQAEGTNAVTAQWLRSPATAWSAGIGRPTGLSRFDAAGSVVLVDEDRGLVRGITRPSWAGALVCGEAKDGGARILAPDGRELVLWAFRQTFVPRLAHDPATGMYGCVTHGLDGVRVATFTEADLTLPVPVTPPTWDATGTPVDCAPFFDIRGATVTRVAADGQIWQCHRRGEELHIVKGAKPWLVEILRLTPDDVRLAYDATDGRYPRAWRLDVVGDGRSDVRWCRNLSEVGWTHTYEASLIRRSDGGPSTSERFPYCVGVEAHGRHVDYGGDVGVVDAVLVTTYTPQAGRTADGYFEKHHWMIKNGRALGLIQYDEVRHGVITRSFVFNRYDPLAGVSASALIVLPIPDPPSVEPTPMPSTPWYTDQVASAFGVFLVHKYVENLGRGEGPDPLGWVRWVNDFIRLMDAGSSAIRATDTVNERINEIASLPRGTWPPSVPPPDVPAQVSSRLVGALRLSS